jgi:hypothetical protein
MPARASKSTHFGLVDDHVGASHASPTVTVMLGLASSAVSTVTAAVEASRATAGGSDTEANGAAAAEGADAAAEVASRRA